MSDSIPSAIPPEEASAPLTHAEALAASEEAHPDPITGEPGAHPIGVGVGALGAGAAGAALGVFGGPIGVVLGAAIGAVAGGLAGKEVAASTAVDETSLTLATDAPVPIGISPFADDAAAGTAASGFIEPAYAANALGLIAAEESVREAAYYIYVRRLIAGAPGDALGDWVEAERGAAAT